MFLFPFVSHEQYLSTAGAVPVQLSSSSWQYNRTLMLARLFKFMTVQQNPYAGQPFQVHDSTTANSYAGPPFHVQDSTTDQVVRIHDWRILHVACDKFTNESCWISLFKHRWWISRDKFSSAHYNLKYIWNHTVHTFCTVQLNKDEMTLPYCFDLWAVVRLNVLVYYN